MVHARFFAPALAAGAETLRLPPEEGAHLARVLRLGVGAEVAVFDGRGQEFLARVDSIARSQVTVRVLHPLIPAPEPRVSLTLAQAVLKGERMDQVIRDAAMLGVAAIRPVASAHTGLRVTQVGTPARAARWSRVVVASIKQCRRAVVPPVLPAMDLVEYAATERADERLMFVEPAAARAEGPHLDELRARPCPRSAAVLIGPEGGWAPDEVLAATRAGFTPVTLGGRTLRADATPVIALALVQFLWGDL
jgi:16S rRNA (uracil1498-N3)-methyltransferase